MVVCPPRLTGASNVGTERVPELADLPVIFISVYRRHETIARALNAGATDYIVKPFSPMELTARVHAALRRIDERDSFLLGDLAIDYEQRRVTVAGHLVRLTATEYELVRVLSTRAGRVTTYDSLISELWRGRKSDGHSRALRAIVKRIRRKLGDDASQPAYIFTERGVGYRIPEPDNPR